MVVPPAPRPPSLWRDYGRHAVLFVLTALSVTFIGGPLFALSLLAILVAHEMGHYLYCRYHRVDATLPFFIPLPIGFGTLGAIIRIRSPFPNRKALFDIGVAGPLVGFLVCLPVVYFGMREAVLEPIGTGDGIPIGVPLLFQIAAWLMRDTVPDGMAIAFGPVGMAAWFGLFVTSLNLMPIGQLDGGHVTYSLLPRWAPTISRIASWLCVGLVYFGPNWILWAILVRVLGRRRHPPTLNDAAPAGRRRAWLGIASLVVFVLCFVPNPLIVSWADLFDNLLTVFTSR